MQNARKKIGDERADDVEAPRPDRGGAEERRGERLQAVADRADLRAGAAVARDEEDAGERGERAREDERQHHEPLDRQPHEPRRARVRADAVQVAPERRVFEQVVHERRARARARTRCAECRTSRRMPKSVRRVEIPVMIDWLFVYQTTMPDNTAEIPSVTINEFTPIRATVRPTTMPTSAPTAMPSSTATPTGMPKRAMNPAQSTCASPATGPTEKSNSPHTSGNMIASESTPSTAWLPRTFLMFADVGNVPDVSPQRLKKTKTAMNTSTSA